MDIKMSKNFDFKLTRKKKLKKANVEMINF